MRFSYLVAQCALLASAAALGYPGVAQQDKPAQVDHLAALRSCQGQTDPATRLACYDTAVAEVVSAAGSGQIKVIDQAEIKRTRRGLFGFSLPDLGIFGGGDEEPDMDMLETSITSVRYSGSDAFTFQTKEGATWQVTNAPARLRQVRAGDEVVFKKASMGSYFIRIDGQIGIKGRRVQ